jgi:hypothetical protein
MSDAFLSAGRHCMPIKEVLSLKLLKMSLKVSNDGCQYGALQT